MMDLKPGKYEVEWSAEASGTASVEVIQSDIDNAGGDFQSAIREALMQSGEPSVHCDLENLEIENVYPSEDEG